MTCALSDQLLTLMNEDMHTYTCCACQAAVYLLLVGKALAEQPNAEAQVVSILHLLPKELLLAVPGQQGFMLLQALLHPPPMLIHGPAVGLGIYLRTQREPSKGCHTWTIKSLMLNCICSSAVHQLHANSPKTISV